jgi:hypothetical protein
MFGKKKLLPHDAIKSYNIGSNWKIIFVFQVFAIKATFEERTKFLLWEIAVAGLLLYLVYCCTWSIAVAGLLLYLVYCCTWPIALPGLMLHLVYCCTWSLLYLVYCCTWFMHMIHHPVVLKKRITQSFGNYVCFFKCDEVGSNYGRAQISCQLNCRKFFRPAVVT